MSWDTELLKVKKEVLGFLNRTENDIDIKILDLDNKIKEKENELENISREQIKYVNDQSATQNLQNTAKDVAREINDCKEQLNTFKKLKSNIYLIMSAEWSRVKQAITEAEVKRVEKYNLLEKEIEKTNKEIKLLKEKEEDLDNEYSIVYSQSAYEIVNPLITNFFNICSSKFRNLSAYNQKMVISDLVNNEIFSNRTKEIFKTNN